MFVLRHSIPLGIIIGFSLLLSQISPHTARADSGFFDEDFEFEEEEETFFYEEEPLYYEEEAEIVEVFDEYEFAEDYDEVDLEEEIDVSDIDYEEFEEEEEFDDYDSYSRDSEGFLMTADEEGMDMEMDMDMDMDEDSSFFDFFMADEDDMDMMEDGDFISTAVVDEVVEEDFEDYGDFSDSYDDYGFAGGGVGGCAVVSEAALESGLVTLDCGTWSLALEGLIQVDAAFFNSVDENVSSSYADIRRAYLGLEGTYGRDWAYELKGVFAAAHEYQKRRTNAGLHDAYIRYHGFDDAILQVGLMTIPFGLEQTSHHGSEYFMERPGFYDITSFAIMGRTAKRGNTVAAAVHIGGLGGDDGTKESANAQGDVGVAGRFTSAFKLRNRSLLHVGFSGRYANFNSTKSKESSILGIGAPFSGTFSDTLNAVDYKQKNGNQRLYLNEEFYAINPEMALVMGPLALQAEYTLLRPTVTAVSGGVSTDSTMHLWYAQMNYWITGETNNYDYKSATFGRVKPRNDFLGSGRGTGAIGFGVRYQYADLQDGIANFGRHEGLTVNMTWLPNAYTKFVTEFVRAWVVKGDGSRQAPYGIQFRAQVGW